MLYNVLYVKLLTLPIQVWGFTEVSFIFEVSIILYIYNYKISSLLIRNGISRPRLLCKVAAVCALAAAADELYIKFNDENTCFQPSRNQVLIVLQNFSLATRGGTERGWAHIIPNNIIIIKNLHDSRLFNEYTIIILIYYL